MRLGIAGGIGSGKSALCEVLQRAGVVVLDADHIAREVVEPGEPAWRALVDAFGQSVLTGDGAIDRQFLADVAFPHPPTLRRLNAITHGIIGLTIIERLSNLKDRNAAVALPLFRPEHRTLFQLTEVWGIEVNPEEAVRRLTTYRGFSVTDARARIESQISNDQRSRIVDVVIDNNGTLDEFETKIMTLIRDRGLSG